MVTSTYTAAELSISHHDLLTLSSDKRLSLGISEYAAQQISLDKRLAPERTTARTAYLLWDWAGLGLFGLSIYASFAYHWWCFIVGFFAMMFLYRSNRSGNAANIIDAAFYDIDFYERIALIGGWVYKMHPDVAEQYRR